MMRRLVGLALAAALTAGCQSNREVRYTASVHPEVPLLPPDVTEDATAPILAQPGSRFPGLFSAESFAVLLTGDLLLARLDADAAAYRYPAEQVAAERLRIRNLAAEFLICELHLVSRFGDMGMATDAVGLRNVRVALADDTGRVATAAAVQSGATEEVEYISATEVMRINFVLFPRTPVPGKPPLIQPSTQRIRLLLIGEGSTFVAEWALNSTLQP